MYYNPSYCEYENIPTPWSVIETIERWMQTRRPVRFTVTGETGAILNYPVTIRLFNYEERGGQPGDWYYDIEMKEYRFVQVRNLTQSSGTVRVSSAGISRPSSWEPPTTYTVKSGDSLWKISAKVYHDGGVGWRKIYEANKNVIGKNPNLIYPGQILVIPR